MIDLANFSETETLKNGTAVLIRPVRANDKNRISEAFRNLETESIYTRFFQFKKVLTDEELKAATEVDFENVVALVVTIGEGENEIIIGGGRYVRSDATDQMQSAEVAFTVEEDYHGQGIASFLLRRLASIALQKGVSRFEADVLPENHAMLSVFSHSGFPMKTKLRDGAVHVTLSIIEEDP
ncbi:MAG TPA: GNAT family N-acetyltransferase [Desulfomonilaceae bacterium]|nr:GNAT family N-acetyltransferase [Desulfomonilaceae bacterium]